MQVSDEVLQVGRERKGFNGKYRQESATADKELAMISFSVIKLVWLDGVVDGRTTHPPSISGFKLYSPFLT